MSVGENDGRRVRPGERKPRAGHHVTRVVVAVGVWAASAGAWASPGPGSVGPSVLDGRFPVPAADRVSFGATGGGVEVGEGSGAEGAGGTVGVPSAGPAVAPVPAAVVGGLGLLAAMAVRRRRRQRDWAAESFS